MDNDVKFVRINGRVVPIRKKKDLVEGTQQLENDSKLVGYGAMAGAVGGIVGFAGGKAKTIKNPQSRKFFGKVAKYGIAAAGIGAAYRKVRKYQLKVEEDKNER